MQIILLEKIRGLGALGELKEVKDGYARNYLIPEKKAARATEQNIKQFEATRADLEKRAQQILSQAEQRAAKLNDITLVISALASDEGKLYGSVGINEIKNGLDEREFSVIKREIVLPEGPIHAVGDYVVDIYLHSDVVAKLKVQVIPSK